MEIKTHSPGVLARRGPATTAILQLHVALDYIEPQIFRRLLIRETSNLATLHRAIQAAMGWTDSHLHQFVINGQYYGPELPFDGFDDVKLLSERKQLGTLLRDGTTAFRYEYDFGDSWNHLVTLEETLPPNLSLRRPTCIAGGNACPPEDVGGPPGYEAYVEAVLDPDHPEHDDMIAWNGPGFRPHHFDVAEAEAELERWFRT